MAEGGTGDPRYVTNKKSAIKTLSLLMQSGWSGRAELGLAGCEVPRRPDRRVREIGPRRDRAIVASTAGPFLKASVVARTKVLAARCASRFG